MTVAGDIRFLSHHDMMRTLVRIARRGQLALRHTQGFNPHPVMSLPVPRSVGIASEDERLLLALDEPATPEALLAALNGATIAGIAFVAAAEISKGQCNVPRAVSYRLEFDSAEASAVSTALAELDTREQWPVERAMKTKRNKRRVLAEKRTKTVDLRPRVQHIALEGTTLRLTLAPVDGSWARLGEIATLLGQDKAAAVARITRTHIEDDFPASEFARGATNIPSTSSTVTE
ncbi:MAG: DUF2344 domain-containing protein [Phycisphaerales bacterium]|jgi:radical SAM-linked protein|nr:DUF2344 domain-containing protein [Phycisphaerales bacterium]